MEILIIIIVIVSCFFAISSAVAEPIEELSSVDDFIANLDGFDASQILRPPFEDVGTSSFQFEEDLLLSMNGLNTGLAIDEGGKICLITRDHDNHGSLHGDIISYKDILAVEIFEDGIASARKATWHDATGIESHISNQTLKIELRLTVNRTPNPLHDITFMNADQKCVKYIKKLGTSSEAVLSARHWHGLISVLIDRADREGRAQNEVLVESQEHLSPSGSVADEIAKMAELREQGLITDEEFETQKNKLLT